ncbi:uncharacterized protein BT62DRAFT_451039 [Guyanagaster necrorhizus]|uniref:Uncharacterized protein n=1 Tax=Guyanagaster necrorhizus TaxID=856835 RepID=A0A9P7VLM6_9AGAR|nr:uncharacterized protein BT62DRAFT_451039 [Guyanagaster necrorhizus MCA 3950]KAG7442226.1 hypothetical protein BT62DRAFT_451039 [Guyanagaster necrorhizus MCA 3950]
MPVGEELRDCGLRRGVHFLVFEILEGLFRKKIGIRRLTGKRGLSNVPAFNGSSSKSTGKRSLIIWRLRLVFMCMSSRESSLSRGRFCLCNAAAQEDSTCASARPPSSTLVLTCLGLVHASSSSEERGGVRGDFAVELEASDASDCPTSLVVLRGRKLLTFITVDTTERMTYFGGGISTAYTSSIKVSEAPFIFVLLSVRQGYVKV